MRETVRNAAPVKWLNDPVKFRQLNGWLVIVWLIVMPISIITGLWHQIAYVSVLSIYANVATHWGGWAAAKSDPKAELDTDSNTA